MCGSISRLLRDGGAFFSEARETSSSRSRSRLVADALFRHGLVLARPAAAVDLLAVAADEMVPVVQVLALVDETIGAGIGRPVDRLDDLGRELHADGNVFLAVLVVAALAGGAVQQFTVQIGEEELPALLVLELDEAALGAAVAQRFPLSGKVISLQAFLFSRRVGRPSRNSRTDP